MQINVTLVKPILACAISAIILGLTACLSTLESANQTLEQVNRGLACRDNNDSFQCADSIKLGEEYQERISIPEDSNKPNEADFYVFEINQPGVIEVAVDPAPPEVGLNSQVFDSQQEPMLKLRERTRNEGQSLFYEVLAEEGTYYLSVFGDRYDESSDPYTLKVTLDTEDEHEINNTFAQASALSIGEQIEAKIRPSGDADYYKFEVQEAGTLEAALESVPPEMELQATLFNRRQEVVGRTSYGDEGKSLYHSLEVQPGMYYLAVGGGRRQASDDTYTLGLSMKQSE